MTNQIICLIFYLSNTGNNSRLTAAQLFYTNVLDMIQEQGKIRKAIFSSSIGTFIEWYPIFIIGLLAQPIAVHFFPKGNDTTKLFYTWAILAAGLIMRLLGAWALAKGEKPVNSKTNLYTSAFICGAACCIGLIPGYTTVGIAASFLFLLLWLILCLASGYIFSNSAITIAQHAPQGKVGYCTALLSIAGTLGGMLALVIMMIIWYSCEKAFHSSWGAWRYPLWLSVIVLLVTWYVQKLKDKSLQDEQLNGIQQSEDASVLKNEGSKNDFKKVLWMLFGTATGPVVIWFTISFYVQLFLAHTVKLDSIQQLEMMLWSMALASPFFIIIGAWRNRIIRIVILLAGMTLLLYCYRPIINFMLMNTDTAEWKERIEGMRYVQLPGLKNPALQTDTVIKQKDTVLLKHYTEWWHLQEGLRFKESYTDTAGIDSDGGTWLIKSKQHDFSDKRLTTALKWKYIFCIWLMIVLGTMVQGPVTAWSVEALASRHGHDS